MDGRLGIDRVAHGGERGELRARIAAAQERALPGALAHPGHQRVEAGVEPDGKRPVEHPRARLGVHEGTAAGGDDRRPGGKQPGDHPLLTIPEMRFPEAVENLGNRHPGGRLDLLVGIPEGKAEAGGKAPPDARLARPHHADQHDRPVDPDRRIDRGERGAWRRKALCGCHGRAYRRRMPRDANPAPPPGRPGPAGSGWGLPAVASAVPGPRALRLAAAAFALCAPAGPAGAQEAPAPEPVELADPLAGMGGPEGQPEAAGLIGPGTTGLPADLFRGSDARFLAALLDGIEAPLASRWGQILFQRALLSLTEAPPGLDPADWLAARARALVAVGAAADAHRMLMRIALDRYTPRLVAVSGHAALAAGDPVGLCPVAVVADRLAPAPFWQLAEGMCAGLVGDEVAAAIRLDPFRRRRLINPFDVGLAERLAASVGGTRRAANPEWSEAGALTAWRVGLASAAGLAIPDELVAAAPPAVRAWLVRLPGQPVSRRAALAPAVAATGAISGAELDRILAAEAATLDPAASARSPGGLLRQAQAGERIEDRLRALRALWSRAQPGTAEHYGWRVATAAAAARIPPDPALAGDAPEIVASLLSVGLVAPARRWWPALADAQADARAAVHVALLAVDPALAPDPGLVRRWGDAAPPHRRALVEAGLEGLGRLAGGEGPPVLENAWTRAIERAAAAGRRGEVLCLVATGLQGEWRQVPPDHLRRIVRALRGLGLATEAGLIVAEAAARG